MEVDSPPPCSSPSIHSSPVSSRLSVVCSLSDHYSGHSSPQSSPMSRRNSISEAAQETWKRMKAAGKTKINSLDMEHRLLALAQENDRLRAQLESNRSSTSTVFDLPFPGTPAPLTTVPGTSSSLDQATLQKLQAIYPGMVMPQAPQLPMLHLCQLQAALQQQYGSPALFNAYPIGDGNNGSVLLPNPQAATNQPGPSTTAGSGASSAFQPFAGQKGSVIKMTRDRISPDSTSTDPVRIRTNTRKESSVNANPPVNQPPSAANSLLGALLSNRRPSPTVPQSTTERRSGLASPQREQNHNNLPPTIPTVAAISPSNAGSSLSSVSLSLSGSSKSDSESHSSASLSPTEGRPEEQKEGSRKQQYMERRRRNNEAAKRCRANRRAVFEYRSRRVEVLEGENDDLRKEIDDLKREIERCRGLIIQREQNQNNQMS